MKTIRQLRAGKGWTQLDLANQLGVQPSTIYNWESGRFHPDVVSFRALARALGATMEDIALVGVDTDRDGNPIPQASEEQESTA